MTSNSAPEPRTAPTARDSGVMAQLPRVRAPTPVRFIVYAYGLTWLVAWPLVLTRAGMLPTPAPFWIHYLAGYGPLLAAAVVAYGEGEKPGFLAWARSLVRPVSAGWWALGASPFIVFALVVVALALTAQPTPPFASLGRIAFLPALNPWVALLLWTVTSGVGEEAGWRGILQPILQHLYGPLRGTLFVAVVWVGWHAPFFFYVPGYAAMAPVMLVGFALSLACASVILAWMRNASGSVLPCIVFHASFNALTASAAAQGRVGIVLSVTVIVGAAAVLVLTKGRLGARPSAGDPMPV